MRKVLPGLLAVSAVPVSIFLGAGAAHADDAPDCRPLVIGVGGAQERYMESMGRPTVIQAHLQAAADQGNRVESLDYESSVWPEGPYTKDESVADGRAKLDQAIADYRAQCPGGDVTVIGHSEGAEVAGDEAAQADHVVTYGDPRTPGGIYSALPGIFPGSSNSGPRDTAPNEKRVCHQYDGICDSPAPWSDPAGFAQAVDGYISGWHGYAPGEADGVPEGTTAVVPEPVPTSSIPDSTPTGIPALPPISLPQWTPGPLPSIQDLDPIISGIQGLIK